MAFTLSSEPYWKEMVYTGSADGSIRGWSLSSGELLERYTGHKGEVRCVSVMGDRLVSGGTDNAVRTWSRETCESVAVIEGLESCCNTLHLDEERLILGPLDAGLGSWDVKLSEIVPSKGPLTTSSTIHGDTLYLGRSDGEIMAFQCPQYFLPRAPAKDLERAQIPLRLLKQAKPIQKDCWGLTNLTGKMSLQEEKAARAASEREAARAEKEATQNVMGELENMLEATIPDPKFPEASFLFL